MDETTFIMSALELSAEVHVLSVWFGAQTVIHLAAGELCTLVFQYEGKLLDWASSENEFEFWKILPKLPVLASADNSVSVNHLFYTLSSCTCSEQSVSLLFPKSDFQAILCLLLVSGVSWIP